MRCEVEYTDEFAAWWDELDEGEQVSVAAHVNLLESFGTELKHPYSSGISGSRHGHLRELRIQHAGRPYRVLYAFDPLRKAILLIGGNKTGNKRWYAQYIPVADRLYDKHLETLARERSDNGKKIQ
ncbi:type II toxin-antitoxin system RelE/ParE family toxin [Herbaspirillum seropedicae]|uniref:type II toxin-antitoxin system RelE/ParE family toxin n=1 Tax=Herbaspirillum seropedicae TaxID=964 RepID=UPI00285F89C1|nr:type II toxin-antitoxin system RelE/ParE family toxin [Herbaspirillum seropedicae]MDR6396421.1 hypothetical protein [Herbaspirillum seropedicae]